MKLTTLLFLRRDGEILLGFKKQRFGASKWNGIGGKLEPGETVLQAAIREVEEEICVTPKNPKLAGELHFFDLPDTEHYCYIFEATEWEGEPQETEDMRPQWFKESEIPFDTMWHDDRFWLPKFLAGIKFKGIVKVSADNKLLQCDITEVKSLEEQP